MSPAYVQRYISENDLVAPDQDVFARLEEKMARLYVDQVPEKGGSVEHRDAADFLRSRDLRGRADLILTSPPYLKVVNYGTSNWIRLWWLGVEDVGRQHGEGRRRLDTDLDHGHGYVAYRDFMLRILQGVQQALSTNGVAALVIGDVASPGEESLDLANQLWTDVGDYLNLDLLCLIEDDLPSQSKVSRIWGDTRGEATNRDCILLLARPGADPVDNPEVDWSEPYRDAGPDLAHEILNRTKRR
jgi:site-specific DNA-methyltransferase (adenine-specific)